MSSAALQPEPAFAEGIALFNAGQFWHAHEAWEAIWLRAKPPVREYVQGLIQTAAALVHWQRGNRRGLSLNWGKARPKLVALPALFGGLELAALVDWMDSMDAGGLDRAPQLRLIWPDGALTPTSEVCDERNNSDG